MTEHLALGHCYLCVRTLDGSGAPVVGASWQIFAEGNGWYSARRVVDDTLLTAWRANSVGSEGLFALFGPKTELDAIAAVETRCIPARELWAAALGGNATAITVVRRWPIWRFTGSERVGGSLVAVTGVVRRLIYEGQSMPTPATVFPWRFDNAGVIVATDPAAQYRVDSIARPAFDRTIAGYPCHVTAEDEPPRS